MEQAQRISTTVSHQITETKTILCGGIGSSEMTPAKKTPELSSKGSSKHNALINQTEPTTGTMNNSGLAEPNPASTPLEEDMQHKKRNKPTSGTTAQKEKEQIKQTTPSEISHLSDYDGVQYTLTQETPPNNTSGEGWTTVESQYYFKARETSIDREVWNPVPVENQFRTLELI